MGLGCQEYLITAATLRQRGPENAFALSPGIAVARIQQVDAGIEGAQDHSSGLGLGVG
jgi:hypothetical protein